MLSILNPHPKGTRTHRFCRPFSLALVSSVDGQGFCFVWEGDLFTSCKAQGTLEEIFAWLKKKPTLLFRTPSGGA